MSNIAMHAMDAVIGRLYAATAGDLRRPVAFWYSKQWSKEKTQMLTTDLRTL